MGFPRQEYWSGLLFPTPGDLPDPGIEHTSPALAGGFLTTESPLYALSQKKVNPSFLIIFFLESSWGYHHE